MRDDTVAHLEATVPRDSPLPADTSLDSMLVDFPLSTHMGDVDQVIQDVNALLDDAGEDAASLLSTTMMVTLYPNTEDQQSKEASSTIQTDARCHDDTPDHGSDATGSVASSDSSDTFLAPNEDVRRKKRRNHKLVSERPPRCHASLSFGEIRETWKYTETERQKSTRL